MFSWKLEELLRPTLRFLDDDLLKRIVREAREVLFKFGLTVQNAAVLAMLSDHGAKVDREKFHVRFSEELLDRALSSVKSIVRLYDVMGNQTNDFSDANVHFTPGSSAIYLLDTQTQEIRKPDTSDYVRYTKLVSRLENIASQSTAFIPADVPEPISDSYRLYLSFLFCEKPVITGTFSREGFEIMKNLQLAIRGSEEELKAKPLTVFSCCPISPLKWSEVTSQNLVDCARFSIPVEIVPMPLSGFTSPVTLVGTLIQHTAEVLGGVVISQVANPGTPVIYGGSPAAFDVRYETAPMGAVETQMLVCAANEIGKFLGFPTQGYIGLSDSKFLDAQAGLETAMGATMAVLSGINNISGPGMLDFENCQSLERLVLDNEICGMLLRMVRGIEPREDFPAIPRFEELMKEKHLLVSKHSRRYLKVEHRYPGRLIDRAGRSRWGEEGGKTLLQRASEEIEKHLKDFRESRLPADVKRELGKLMADKAAEFGMDRLPQIL